MKRGEYTRKLADQQVVDILTSDESDRKTAQHYGVSRMTIYSIRTGKHFTHICPELPRRSGKTCTLCQHWRKGQCGFGFPDPLEDGPAAANYCNLYMQQ